MGNPTEFMNEMFVLQVISFRNRIVHVEELHESRQYGIEGERTVYQDFGPITFWNSGEIMRNCITTTYLKQGSSVLKVLEYATLQLALVPRYNY